MDDELDLNLEEDTSREIINRRDKKINSLSEKLGNTEKEKAELAKAKEEAEAKAQAAQKDADFFKGFNSISSKYQGAGEYQDQIREKVMSGYDMEDAAISILAKEGKYQPLQPEARREMAAGGSASIGINQQADKPLNSMSREEMRSQLQELESKGEFKL
jgi:hypothetical protein